MNAMLTWIAAVLLLYFAQIYLATALFMPDEGIRQHLAGRDNLPERGLYAGRAHRALVNLKENLPFFLVPAILSLIIDGVAVDQAILAAQVFFFARIGYAVCYVFAVPVVRTIFYFAGLAANVYAFMLLF